MIPLPLARIAEITSGALTGMADPRAVVRGPVVIDSRAVEPGSLFVAIKGARVDGHDYAAQAIRAGAVAVLATRPVEGPAVIVPDAAAALAELATAQAAALPKVTVIGVTGSAGKTSTKDLLARLTARVGPTIAPVGSFNNELGHPLTVLRADLETRFMVLELAARNIGHIKDLTRIAPPQIGVVLNVGTAHLGVFGGKEAIAKAKGELVEALPRTGVAVLNADDPLVRAMASRTDARVTFFGRGESASIRAEGVTVDARGRASFTLRTPSGSAPVSLQLYGEHAVDNALAAAAAGYELGLPVATIAAELSQATPLSRWRMEVTDRADGVTVVNDAYNANPDSMRAAFAAFEVLGRGRRRFAVIAALRELGEEGPALNAELGRLAGGSGLAGLIVAGPDAGPVLEGARAAAAEAQAAAQAALDAQAAAQAAAGVPQAPVPHQSAPQGWHGPSPDQGWHGPSPDQGWHGPSPDQGWHGPSPEQGAPQPGGPPMGAPFGGAPAGPHAGGPHPGGPVAGASPGGGAAYPAQAMRIVHVPDAEAAAAELAGWLRPGDAVLVKGPRAMGLERTAELVLGGAAQ
ncbi:UDP-N-acetylmuramoyl-tripeptide--D-alanyl-D-alanine ligase [Nonomuraea sp. JJY05]|uniref:UDP-N-acetylmuramoyl-tripeptide--D-alanyl-D- alanine ligase n=1 Tax=Nonomuraea sp. JJY05 TaxID=3350255 RepID=UPI00373E2F6A